MGESYTGVPALERAAQVLEQVLHAPAGLAAKELYRSCDMYPEFWTHKKLN